MKRLISVAVAGVFLLIIAGVAQAAMDTPVVFDDSIPNIIGVAVGMVPDYQGSDDYKAAPAPFFRFSFWGERYVQLLATEMNVNLIDDPVLRFGPSLNYRFGRSDSVDDDVVKRMDELKGTIEAGAFIGAVFKNASNPRQRFSMNLDFLQDVGGHSKGYTLTLLGRYWHPISKPIDLTLGVSTSYASDKYMNYYFGVNSGNVGTSHLPFFSASGGMKDVTVSPGITYHLSQSWHLGAGFRYQRLLGDAKDSPVVAIRGSADQWVYGIALAYSW